MGDRDEENRQSNGGNEADGSGQGEGEQSDGGQNEGDDQSEQSDQPSTAETAAMVVSVGFALCLLAFAGWQIATPAAATAPEASVVDVAELQNGDLAVTVELRNPGGAGLVSATVESHCTTPPADVGFDYVPASSTRRGTVVCPPGTADPSVSVANWVTV